MVDAQFDMSEVAEFSADLAGVPGVLARHAVPVLKRAAQNVKTEMQADFRGSSNAGFRKIAGSVSYDEPGPGGGGYTTEIGIDKGGAGSLGNLAVFGSWKGGGTHSEPAVFAEAELPAFEREVANAARELLS